MAGYEMYEVSMYGKAMYGTTRYGTKDMLENKPKFGHND